MTIYLIKVVLCSGLFLLAFYTLLEKEKMHRFNRFYLLGSLVFSFCIPLVSFESTSEVSRQIPEVWKGTGNLISQNSRIERVENPEIIDYSLILWIVYGAVTFAFLIRFFKNLNRIIRTIKNKAITPYQNAKVILINEKLIPHSFMNYIFINKEAYERGQVEHEIMLHELTHVRQRHSLDVLFIELLNTLFWFNPAFRLYKKAIQLNHEFLADEAVVQTYNNTPAYQFLLIDKASQSGNLVLSSPFNFLITKKRLIMMTKTTNPGVALCKQLAIAGITGVCIFLFSSRIDAQQSPEALKPPAVIKGIPSNPQGASEQTIQEYNEIVKRHTVKKGNTIRYQIPKAEQARLERIFISMSKEQQEQQKVYFTKFNEPFKNQAPSKEQIDTWKDGKKYGIWIDGKRATNTVLHNYKYTDFVDASSSKLAKNAINYGKHYFQVDLMTKPYYDNYVKETLADDKNYMMVRFNKL